LVNICIEGKPVCVLRRGVGVKVSSSSHQFFSHECGYLINPILELVNNWLVWRGGSRERLDAVSKVLYVAFQVKKMDGKSTFIIKKKL